MDEKTFYDKVGEKIGWDFSSLDSRMIVENKKWVFLDVVKSYLKKSGALLDIGTGGGEKLLKLAEFCSSAVGIDNSPDMVSKALENIKHSGRKNVKVILAESDKLPFEDSSFNIVTARHAPFKSKEIHRVMKKNGIFITQQVGERDKLNIKKVFGRGQAFEKTAGDLFRKCIKDLKEAGFKILTADQYDATEYYAGMNDIIFLLDHTPIVPDFNRQQDEQCLRELEFKYKTDKGIMTNSDRFLIIAKKL